jgi:hypothetical protein
VSDLRLEPRQPGRVLLPYREARHTLGGISAPILHRMIDNGDIDRVRIGKRCFITAESIDRFIANQLEQQANQ